MIRHYALTDGLAGYANGDVLHETMMDDWALVVRDGRGLCMQALAVTRRTGETCVGDWRLSPLDVGFDLRAVGMPVAAPDDMRSMGLDIDGEVYLVTGDAATLVAVARAAGYEVVS